MILETKDQLIEALRAAKYELKESIANEWEEDCKFLRREIAKIKTDIIILDLKAQEATA